MYLDFFETNDEGGAASPPADGLTRCGVCFDLGKEDAELEEGDNGVGICYYYDSNLDVHYDANFFGTVEATGSSGFKFLDKSENDWDTDSGYIGMTSITDGDDITFVSEPNDISSNSRKHLGITKGETYWKCYIGEQDSIDVSSPFDQEISLDKFTTDKPRRIDTSCIEDVAIKMFVGIGVLASSLFL